MLACCTKAMSPSLIHVCVCTLPCSISFCRASDASSGVTKVSDSPQLLSSPPSLVTPLLRGSPRGDGPLGDPNPMIADALHGKSRVAGVFDQTGTTSIRTGHNGRCGFVGSVYLRPRSNHRCTRLRPQYSPTVKGENFFFF